MSTIPTYTDFFEGNKTSYLTEENSQHTDTLMILIRAMQRKGRVWDMNYSCKWPQLSSSSQWPLTLWWAILYPGKGQMWHWRYHSLPSLGLPPGTHKLTSLKGKVNSCGLCSYCLGQHLNLGPQIHIWVCQPLYQ